MGNGNIVTALNDRAVSVYFVALAFSSRNEIKFKIIFSKLFRETDFFCVTFH